MSDEEEGSDLSAEAFYTHVIPSMWIGLLDLCHDIMMRLEDFLEVQGKMVEEARLYLAPEEAEIIPFPINNEDNDDEGA
jgi:hypothetical protein